MKQFTCVLRVSRIAPCPFGLFLFICAAIQSQSFLASATPIDNILPYPPEATEFNTVTLPLNFTESESFLPENLTGLSPLTLEFDGTSFPLNHPAYFSHPPQASSFQQAQVPPPNIRSLEVQEIRGRNTTFKGKAAQLGDRLQQVGDEISTGIGTTMRLRINDYIGVIELAELTTVKLQTLEGNGFGNQITGIYVSQGRVRLSIARSAGRSSRNLSRGESLRVAGLNLSHLGNPERLVQESTSARTAPVRVETPTGVAGVRGTSFGVNVGPNGKSAEGTVEGIVGVERNGQEVAVNTNYHSVMNLGDGIFPTSPDLTPDLVSLKVRSVSRVGSRTVRLLGQVEPFALVYVNNEAIETDSEGKFEVITPLPPSRRVRVVVRGPSVRERHYTLMVP